MSNLEISPFHLQRKSRVKENYKRLNAELEPCHLKTSAELEPCHLKTEVELQRYHLKTEVDLFQLKVTLNPLYSFKIIPCHNPDRRFSYRDCSRLSVGDRVMGNVLGIKFKLGTLTKLDYEDHGTWKIKAGTLTKLDDEGHGNWKEIISMNVRLDDGRDVNPYPDQLLKLVSDGLIKH